MGEAIITPAIIIIILIAEITMGPMAPIMGMAGPVALRRGAQPVVVALVLRLHPAHEVAVAATQEEVTAEAADMVVEAGTAKENFISIA